MCQQTGQTTKGTNKDTRTFHKDLDRVVNKKMNMAKFNNKEIQNICAMGIVLFHAGEHCYNLIWEYYKDCIRESVRYKQIARQFGKMVAEAQVSKECDRVMKHENKYKCNEIVKHAEAIKRLMEQMTDLGSMNFETETDIEAKKKMTKEELEEWKKKRFWQVAEMNEALTNDTKLMLRMISRIVNCCTTDENILKTESAIKMLAKGTKLSDNIIKYFEEL